MDERQSEDSAIHFAVRRGDADAWRQWYQLYFDELYSFVSWRCNGKREDTEEIVQDAFLALFLHLRADKPRTNLVGWLFRVAHNMGLKRLASAAREHSLHPIDSFDLHRDPAPDAECQIVSAERSARLQAVVAALTDHERQCLSLRAEGFRYREISEIVGISLGSVAALLTRALDKLRRADPAG